MKIYSPQTIIQNLLSRVTCDWCGCDIKDILNLKRGCGEGRDYYIMGRYEFDLCESCCHKLYKLLVENGIKIRSKNETD